MTSEERVGKAIRDSRTVLAFADRKVGEYKQILAETRARSSAAKATLRRAGYLRG